MHLSLLLLASTLGFAPAPAASPPNLDFRDGRLTGWEGSGFQPGPASGRGPTLSWGVSSADEGKSGKKALLHQTFIIPEGTATLQFQAAVSRPEGLEPAGTLDVALEASGRTFLPKRLLTTDGLRSVDTILPFEKGRLRTYQWDVSAYNGRTVRLALIDSDDRPGCSLFCSGFRLIAGDSPEVARFWTDMKQLQKANGLPAVRRGDSRHFLALGTANIGFMQQRLDDCQTIHALFFDHFRRRGFEVRQPGGKLLVAVFDSQKGFEAYLGRQMPTSVTGLYHPASNRMVVYDYSGNRAFLAGREKNRELLDRARTDLERGHMLVTLGRAENDRLSDANIGTMMHEVAHQLSFNCGLLNRQGDVPVWLAEGLACYCESTINGSWQGIGKPNPQRAAGLAGPIRGKGAWLPLRDLVSNDDWIRRAKTTDQVLLGYAQSWALFGWLMRDKPEQLQRYLRMLAERRTPEHRLTDFGTAFGSDLNALDRRYQAYIRELVREQVRER
jgi:hypothetical protein